LQKNGNDIYSYSELGTYLKGDSLLANGTAELTTRDEKTVLKNIQKNGNFSDGTNHWTVSNATVSVANNVATITATASAGGLYSIFSNTSAPSNHIYYGYCTLISGSSSNYIALYDYGNNNYASSEVPASSGGFRSVRFAKTTSDQLGFLIRDLWNSSGWSSFTVQNAGLIDLTAAFGGGLEPTKAEMDAILLKLFPDTNGWFDGTDVALLDSQAVKSMTLPQVVAERSTASDEFVKNMLHLGYYDTYVKDANGNYVVTRQTGYIDCEKETWTITTWADGNNSYYWVLKDNVSLSTDGKVHAISNLYQSQSDVNVLVSSSNIVYVGTDDTLSKIAVSAKPLNGETPKGYIQYQLVTSYTETYDPLHFARIQPYALEYAKSEADRASNLWGGSQSISISANNETWVGTPYISVSGLVVGRMYCLSAYANATSGSPSMYVSIYDGSEHYITETPISTASAELAKSFVATTSTIKFIFMCAEGTATTGSTTYTNIMLNEGSNPLPYQPYEGPVTHDGSLAAVAKSGEYSDLKDKPALFSGKYDDLKDKPTLFSGSYTDLSNKPTIPSKVSELTNDSEFLSTLPIKNFSSPGASNIRRIEMDDHHFGPDHRIFDRSGDMRQSIAVIHDRHPVNQRIELVDKHHR
jgi:hypothetical protein